MDYADECVVEEARNWAELQRDLLSLIFEKLGGIQVLSTAQMVCSSWMRLSYDPQTWRHIDMAPDIFTDNHYDIEKMAKAALDRSCGQCVEFSMEYFATDDLMQYLIDKVSVLKALRLRYCHAISEDKLIEVVKKFPQLEELEISCHPFSKEVLENAGQSCRQLKHLRLSYHVYKHKECDKEALAIAENMPELRSLVLFNNNLSDDGLWVILDSCPHLESLNLRNCFNINLVGDLLSKCLNQIKDLEFMNDHITDCDVENCVYISYDDDDGDYLSRFSFDGFPAEMYFKISDGSYISYSDLSYYMD